MGLQTLELVKMIELLGDSAKKTRNLKMVIYELILI